MLSCDESAEVLEKSIDPVEALVPAAAVLESATEETSSKVESLPEKSSSFPKEEIIMKGGEEETPSQNTSQPGLAPLERPKSVKTLPTAAGPSTKKSVRPVEQSDDEDDDEEESEYQPNQLAQIEGLPELSSDESTFSDILHLDMDDEEIGKLSYDELAQLLALETLAHPPDQFLPDLPTVPGGNDEEVEEALLKKRWREAVLDKTRSQLKGHAKHTCNPGIHRSGFRMYQAEDYDQLNTTPEIKELFQYITMYSPPPSSSQVDVKLKPFIPEFYPSVGDIDAFLKVIHPEIGNDNLGIKVLDEPCAFQSDPSVLDLRLRAMAKQSSARAVVVKKVENVGKNTKVIDNWIKDISDLHRSKPSPSIHYSKPMPDIDQLLQEWPPGFEKLLASSKLPPPDLDCDLKTYVNLVCNILDIPVYKSRIQSLHVLATLYLAHKSFGNYGIGGGAGGRKKNIAGNEENGVDRLELE